MQQRTFISNLEKTAEDLHLLFNSENNRVKLVDIFLTAYKNYHEPTNPILYSSILNLIYYFTRTRTIPVNVFKNLIDEISSEDVFNCFQDKVPLNDVLSEMIKGTDRSRLAKFFIEVKSEEIKNKMISKYANQDQIQNLLNKKITKHQLINELFVETLGDQQLVFIVLDQANLSDIKDKIFMFSSKETISGLFKKYLSAEELLDFFMKKASMYYLRELYVNFFADGKWKSTSANTTLLTLLCGALEGYDQSDKLTCNELACLGKIFITLADKYLIKSKLNSEYNKIDTVIQNPIKQNSEEIHNLNVNENPKYNAIKNLYFRYELELMPHPDYDQNKAVFGKIYLSEDGFFVMRDHEGVIKKDMFSKVPFEKEELIKNIKNTQFINHVLNEISKTGCVLYDNQKQINDHGINKLNMNKYRDVIDKLNKINLSRPKKLDNSNGNNDDNVSSKLQNNIIENKIVDHHEQVLSKANVGLNFSQARENLRLFFSAKPNPENELEETNDNIVTNKIN